MRLKIIKAGELSQSAIFRNVVKFAVNFNHVFPPNSAQKRTSSPNIFTKVALC